MASIKKYYIVPISELAITNDSNIIETPNTVRLNQAGTHFICKMLASNTSNILDAYTVYTHTEIRQEVVKPEWSGE